MIHTAARIQTLNPTFFCRAGNPHRQLAGCRAGYHPFGRRLARPATRSSYPSRRSSKLRLYPPSHGYQGLRGTPACVSAWAEMYRRVYL